MLFSKEKNFVEWKICIQDCIQQSSRLDQAKFTSVMYFNFQFYLFYYNFDPFHGKSYLY